MATDGVEVAVKVAEAVEALIEAVVRSLQTQDVEDSLARYAARDALVAVLAPLFDGPVENRDSPLW